MGKGSFGTVVKAQNRVTGQVVAIKHISNAFANIESAKQVFREITILRQLSKLPNNLFTPKIFQIIAPGFTQ